MSTTCLYNTIIPINIRGKPVRDKFNFEQKTAAIAGLTSIFSTRKKNLKKIVRIGPFCALIW